MTQPLDPTKLHQAAQKAASKQNGQPAKETQEQAARRVKQEQERVRREEEQERKRIAEEQEAIRDEAAGRICVDLWGETREPPVPLTSLQAPPEFPLDCFHETIGAFVDEVAGVMEVSVDLPAILALGAIAIGAAKKWTVQANRTWKEPLNLYLTVGLPSGEVKSPTFNAVLAPVKQYDIELRKAWQKECDSIAQENQGKPKKEQRQYPVEPRVYSDDVTPESLASLMATQGERMAVLSEEGTLFGHLCGMYSKTPNNAIFLKGHDGGTYSVDRRDTTKKAFLKYPSITSLIATQPDVLEALGARPELRGQGMLARFLYGLPRSRVGEKMFAMTGLDPVLQETYNRVISRLLLTRPLSWPQVAPLSKEAHFELGAPQALLLDADALEMFRDYCVHLDRLSAPDQPLASIRDWASKLRGATLRIAGLLHVVDCLAESQAPESYTISLSTMDRAGRIAEYFLEHAKRVFCLIGRDEAEKDATAVLDWLKRTAVRQFTRRQAQRESTCRHGGRLESATKLLEKNGWIAPVARVGGSKAAGYKVLFYPDTCSTPATGATLA